MKRRSIVIILLVLLVPMLIGAYFVATSLHYRILISSWIASPNPDFIESNQLKRVHIQFSPKDKKHFNRLFRDYYAEGMGPENDSFITYYSEHNQWRKVQFSLDGKTSKVKMKSHGRSPYAHKFGDHFSIKVKFKKKPYPLFSKEVSLIIYNRIQMKSAIQKMLSDKFNLPSPDFELISLKIDEGDEYLYFAEERINKAFFSKRTLPWVIFNKKVDGSLIYSGVKSVDELTRELHMQLTDQKDFSSRLKTQILKDYSSFNLALAEDNIDSLKRYIDLNYISRLNAFRVIFGSDGHGFNGENLEMAYDTTNRLFYPIVHRDVNSTTIADCANPYPFMDATRATIPFWILLDADPSFLEYTNTEIGSFLSENSDNDLETELSKIKNFYKQSHTYERSAMNNGVDGSSIMNNIRCLRNDESE